MDQIEKNRKSIINKKIKSIGFLCLLMTIGIFIYIFEITTISTKGFKITELEKNIKVLEDENKKLTLELANQRKMSKFEEYGKGKNMVKIETVKYITLTSNVAMK